MELAHISEADMERYCLGLTSAVELEQLEEHLLICSECWENEVSISAYVKMIRSALVFLSVVGRTSPRHAWPGGPRGGPQRRGFHPDEVRQRAM